MVFVVDQSIWLLVLGFFILGLFPALTDGTQRAYAATLTDTEYRGSAYGLMNAVSGFGAIVAGFGGGFIWQAYGSSMAFIISSGVVILGLIFFMYIENIKKI